MLILCGFGRKGAIFGAFRLKMMAFAGGGEGWEMEGMVYSE